MTRRGHAYLFAISVLLLLAESSGRLQADQAGASAEWLRGSGKDLQVRLKGEVFDSEGKAVRELTITGSMNAAGSNLLDPIVDEHRFEVWIPVNRARWYSMWLKANSTKDDRVAIRKLDPYEIRQAAIDGIRLTLQAPTRHVEVKVLDDGQPVVAAVAKVKLRFGDELRTRTDSNGIARFGLLPQQQMVCLTAWTDDFRIGGFSFSRRTPKPDPEADQHVVELTRCRNKKLRFVDESGSPVSGLNFLFQIATAPPKYNFIGTNEHSRLTTDAAGEVVCRWFPDWDEHYLRAYLNTDRWITDGYKYKESAGGVVVFGLKRSRIADRKRVTGQVVSKVTGVGGFYVSLSSFQGEREGRSDVISAFTDCDGKFAVDVLPDATYCGFALDSRWVSEIEDLIPYQSGSGQITSPELVVSGGQEVEVIVTSGVQKRPYPNLPISFRREHRYTWREEGRARSGIGGPAWKATTDESGRARTWSLPGKLKAFVFTPQWRAEETVEVVSRQDARLKLHREVEERRTVSGRLVLANGLKARLAEIEIVVGSVDGYFDERQVLKPSLDGSFSFETLSSEVGVFGYSPDGRASGSVVVKNLDSPIELRLRPTGDYHGQLLGKGDQPLVSHGVRAIVRVEGDEDHDGIFVKSIEVIRIQAETNAQGHFTLRGVPVETKVSIHADPVDDSADGVYLGEIYLEPNDSRPRTVSRLVRTETKRAGDELLADKYERTLQDCELMGYHLMVITSGVTREVSDFIDQNFLDYQTNKEIYPYMQILVGRGQDSLKAGDGMFLKERNWRVPGDGRVFAYAVNAHGTELGRIEIDVASSDASAKAASFIGQHLPPQVDAEQKWQEAFAEANRSNRRVWARISQRYCGPCFRMARWLNAQHELLEEDYVMLKIDDVRDRNGRSVAERLTRGKHHGVPFHAIFDPDEVLLIDSEGPLGNIGHPSSFDEKRHLRKMLLETRRKLTDNEIDRLVDSLKDDLP